MIHEWDLTSFLSNHEVANAKKVYNCNVAGCSRSYTNRQNLRRHKWHSTLFESGIQNNDYCLDGQETSAGSEQKEGIEESSPCVELPPLTTQNIPTQLKDRLVKLRELIVADITDCSTSKQNSQSIVAEQLREFRKSISVNSEEELQAFNAVVRWAVQLKPDRIGRLQQFCQVMTTLAIHLARYSEVSRARIQLERELEDLLNNVLVDQHIYRKDSPAMPQNSKKQKTLHLVGSAAVVESHGIGCLDQFLTKLLKDDGL